MALLLAIPAAPARPGAGHREMRASQILATANEMFAQGDFGGARELYLEVLASDPQNLTALKNLGACYFSTGKRGYNLAARYYSLAFEIDPHSQDVAEKLVECLKALGKERAAAAILRKMAEWPDAPPGAWKQAAEASQAAHDAANAESAYEAYLERVPGDLEARTELGNLYGRQNDFVSALEQFRLALSANPNFPPALIGSARLYSWQNQYEESMKLYDRVLRLDPSNGDAAAGKAFVLLWTGKTADAASLFARLHRRFPRDIEIARGLAASREGETYKLMAAAKRAGEPAQAESDYREILASNPYEVDSLKALAALTATPARCAESVKFAHRAVEASPADASLLLVLANSLTICRQYNDAIARTRQYLEVRPSSEDALDRLAHVLLRAGRRGEAIEAYKKLLALDPQNSDAQLGLAQSLAASGDYAGASPLYDEVLRGSPENYDALQGKAFLFFWTNRISEAGAIFETLARRQPWDAQNTEALEKIHRAEEEAHWAAIRPPSGAPPAAFAAYYEKRLASYPQDDSALRGLAAAQAQSGDLPSAITSYKTLAAKFPGDLGAQMELARLEGLAGQYDAAIALYGSILRTRPEDLEALQDLARVYLWSDRLREAFEIYSRLAAAFPSNPDYSIEAARLGLRLGDYAAAREALATTLSINPSNIEARDELAQLDLRQGKRKDSLKQYDRSLDQSPGDPAALMGEARVSYYDGDLPRARIAAATLVALNPRNFDALLLLAEIENARGRRQAASSLLDRAAGLKPDNPEIASLRGRVREASAVTVHTTASYSREIGPPSEFTTLFGVTRTGLPNEDLRLFSYGTTIEAPWLPNLDSYFTFASLPTDVPLSPARDAQGNRMSTPNSGAVAPAFFLTRQVWRLSGHWTLRGGIGVERLGPAQIERLPQLGPFISALEERYGSSVLTALHIQPESVETASISAIAQAGVTFSPRKNFSLDLDLNHSPSLDVPFPYAIQRGLEETRIEGSLNFALWRRSELRLSAFNTLYSTEALKHVDTNQDAISVRRPPIPCAPDTPVGVSGGYTVCLSDLKFASWGTESDRGRGGAITFNENFVRGERFSFDAGYKGLAYGFEGHSSGVYLGFFNPGFYQEHLFTSRLRGNIIGPLGYDFSSGVGIQQIEQRAALLRALTLSPAITLKLSRNHSLTLSYTHYNTAQSLGTLRGNSIQLSTDWAM